MVLRVASKLTPNTNNKGLEFSEVLLEESFEVKSCNRSVLFVMAFMLSSFKVNDIMEI